VRHFDAVEHAERILITRIPRLLHRMRRDSHAALAVNRGNRITERQAPVHIRTNPGGNQVKGRRRDLLTRNHDDVGRLDEVTEPCGKNLIVVGDHDGIEPTARSLSLKLPPGHGAIARERVDVQVDLEDVIRAVRAGGEGAMVEDSPRHDAASQGGAGDDSRRRHETA
jgi:hypothetical protein